jgi:repressor of nif and glnA expression
MRADVQNLFIGIHMLYFAHEKDLTLSEMHPELENMGYRVGEREVKQELERLTQENFLTAHGEAYSITGTGIEEFKAIQEKLQVLCTEVLKPVKAAGTSG